MVGWAILLDRDNDHCLFGGNMNQEDLAQSRRLVMPSDDSSETRTTIKIPGTDILSVKDFGATGDGKANDAEAVKVAIAAGIATNKTVYLPAGDYFTGSSVLTTPATANGKLRICGAGKGVARITRANGVAATTFEIQLTGPAASVSVADLSVIGSTGLSHDNKSAGIAGRTRGRFDCTSVTRTFRTRNDIAS